MRRETYTCDCCGGVYKSDMSDEEAVAQFEAAFGRTPSPKVIAQEGRFVRVIGGTGEAEGSA